MVRCSGVERGTWRSAATAAASATALLVGVLGAVVLPRRRPVLMAEVSGEGGTAFVALSMCLPALALQDSWRYAFFAAGRGGARRAYRRGLGGSVCWCCCPLGAPLGLDGIGWAIVAFGLSAGIAAGVRAWQAGRPAGPAPGAAVVARPARPRRALPGREHHPGRRPAGHVLVVARRGLGALGAVRGAEMLIGPVASLLMGIAQVAVPETVRARAGGRTAARAAVPRAQRRAGAVWRCCGALTSSSCSRTGCGAGCCSARCGRARTCCSRRSSSAPPRAACTSVRPRACARWVGPT